MVIKNGYEARLAKMAGDENVTIPKPTNAYMKYMDDIDIEGGGSALPAVTAADNGKVLTVVEGVWDKADAAGGGSNSIILKISDPEGISQYTIDSPVEFSTLMQTFWQYDKIDAIEVDEGFQSAVNVHFYQGEENSYISMEFIQFTLPSAQTGVVSATFHQFIWNGATVTRTARTGNITFSSDEQ